MRSVFGRRAVATVLLLLLAGGLFILGRLLAAKGMTWAGEFGSIAAFFVAVVALLGPIFARWLRGPSPITTLNVSQATDDLASSLSQQLAEEEQLRRINDPRPLPVRWDVTALAKAAMPGVTFGSVDDNLEEMWLTGFAGQFDDIASVFNRVRSRRLVILGPVGAGKSVLATKLARELLVTRQPGMPVPVILPAANWDPDRKLVSWITTQLISNHPGLAVRVKAATGEATTLAHLIASGSVLPIIDGLDELPHQLRTKVITEINAAGSHLPFVITSRSEQYLTAIAEAGRALSRAMVVEVLPLQIPEVKAYLTEATAAVPARRWDKVFDRLDAEPKGTLASVLATPLMLWLARTVYDLANSDPSELLHYEQFGTPQAIEHHLLDVFVLTVYAREPVVARHRWRPEKAQRWLAFLADYLEKTGSPVIEWWQLNRSARGWRPVGTVIRWVLLSSVAWGLLVWVLRRHSYWRNGTYYHHSSLLGLLLGGPLGQAASNPINRILHDFFSRHSIHVFRLQLGADLRFLLGGSFLSLEMRGALIAAFLGTLAIARSSLPTQPKWASGRFFRAMAVALIKEIGTIIIIIIPAVIILLSILQSHSLKEQNQAVQTLSTLSGSLWIRIFLALLIVDALASATKSCISPLGIYKNLSPTSTLLLDRRATFLAQVPPKASGVTFIWLWCGIDVAVAYGLFSVVTILCRIFFGGRRTASDFYADCRIWLICGRLLPWRMMAFLADAHQRGVLRRVGAVYQFRHISLQQRLAGQYTGQPHRWDPLIEHLSEVMRPYAEKIGSYSDKFDPETQRIREGYGWEVKRVGLSWSYRDPRFEQTRAADSADGKNE